MIRENNRWILTKSETRFDRVELNESEVNGRVFNLDYFTNLILKKQMKELDKSR